jgi:hypothetical protein
MKKGRRRTLSPPRRKVAILGFLFVVALVVIGSINFYNNESAQLEEGAFATLSNFFNFGWLYVTGPLLDEVTTVTSRDLFIADGIADGSVESTKDLTDDVNLISSEEGNILRLQVPGDTIGLQFDVLDLQDYVISSGQDLNVIDTPASVSLVENSGKLKWEYEVTLADVNLFSRVIISSENDEVLIIDENTVKIGEHYLSFADLVADGYVVNFVSPVFVSGEEVNSAGQRGVEQTLYIYKDFTGVSAVGDVVNLDPLFLTVEAEIGVFGCSELDLFGTVYILQESFIHTGFTNCFEITADEVTLDLNGQVIEGSGLAGLHMVSVVNKDGVTVMNGEIRRSGKGSTLSSGVYFERVNEGKIIDVESVRTPYAGIFLKDSTGVVVERGKYFNNKHAGVVIEGGSGNSVLDALVIGTNDHNQVRGVRIKSSSGNSIIGGEFSDNDQGIEIMGDSDDNLIEGVNIHNNFLSGITLLGVSSGNVLKNIRIENQPKAVEDFTTLSELNDLIFENEFGRVKIVDEGFRGDLELRGEIVYPGIFVIEDKKVSYDFSEVSRGDFSSGLEIYYNNVDGYLGNRNVLEVYYSDTINPEVLCVEGSDPSCNVLDSGEDETVRIGVSSEGELEIGEFRIELREPTGCISDEDCDDGNLCTVEDTCVLDFGTGESQCVYRNKVCGVGEMCDEETGECGIEIQGESCLDANGQPDNTKCDDGNLCTIDSCLANGVCDNVEEPCEGGGVCDENTGICLDPGILLSRNNFCYGIVSNCASAQRFSGDPADSENEIVVFDGDNYEIILDDEICPINPDPCKGPGICTKDGCEYPTNRPDGEIDCFFSPGQGCRTTASCEDGELYCHQLAFNHPDFGLPMLCESENPVLGPGCDLVDDDTFGLVNECVSIGIRTDRWCTWLTRYGPDNIMPSNLDACDPLPGVNFRYDPTNPDAAANGCVWDEVDPNIYDGLGCCPSVGTGSGHDSADGIYDCLGYVCSSGDCLEGPIHESLQCDQPGEEVTDCQTDSVFYRCETGTCTERVSTVLNEGASCTPQSFEGLAGEPTCSYCFCQGGNCAEASDACGLDLIGSIDVEIPEFEQAPETMRLPFMPTIPETVRASLKDGETDELDLYFTNRDMCGQYFRLNSETSGESLICNLFIKPDEDPKLYRFYETYLFDKLDQCTEGFMLFDTDGNSRVNERDYGEMDSRFSRYLNEDPLIACTSSNNYCEGTDLSPRDGETTMYDYAVYRMLKGIYRDELTPVVISDPHQFADTRPYLLRYFTNEFGQAEVYYNILNNVAETCDPILIDDVEIEGPDILGAYTFPNFEITIKPLDSNPADQITAATEYYRYLAWWKCAYEIQFSGRDGQTLEDWDIPAIIEISESSNLNAPAGVSFIGIKNIEPDLNPESEPLLKKATLAGHPDKIKQNILPSVVARFVLTQGSEIEQSWQLIGYLAAISHKEYRNKLERVLHDAIRRKELIPLRDIVTGERAANNPLLFEAQSKEIIEYIIRGLGRGERYYYTPNIIDIDNWEIGDKPYARRVVGMSLNGLEGFENEWVKYAQAKYLFKEKTIPL